MEKERLLSNKEHTADLRNYIKKYLFKTDNYYNHVNKQYGTLRGFSSTTYKCILNKHKLTI